MFDWLRKKKASPENKGKLITVDPAHHPLARFQDEMNSLFDRFLSDWGDWPSMPKRTLAAGRRGWDLDVDDLPDQYVVRAEAPGFEPDEFDVQISGNLLTVKAEHKEETKDKQGFSHRYGAIQSSFRLPDGIVSDNVNAQYKNGVLELRLPKSENAMAKRIAVKA